MRFVSWRLLSGSFADHISEQGLGAQAVEHGVYSRGVACPIPKSSSGRFEISKVLQRS
jgi:hypothetical protein